MRRRETIVVGEHGANVSGGARFFHQPLDCALTRGDLGAWRLELTVALCQGSAFVRGCCGGGRDGGPPSSGEGSSGLRLPGHLSSQIALFCSSFLRETFVRAGRMRVAVCVRRQERCVSVCRGALVRMFVCARACLRWCLCVCVRVCVCVSGELLS